MITTGGWLWAGVAMSLLLNGTPMMASEPLGAGLVTITVVSIDADGSILYVPVQFRSLDSRGDSTSSLLCTMVDRNVVMVSGTLVAQVDPSEVRLLSERGTKQSGQIHRVRLLQPARVDVSLSIGDRTLAVGEGPTDLLVPIAVEETVAGHDVADAAITVTLRLLWTERDLTRDTAYIVAWHTIYADLIAKMRGGSTISVEDLGVFARHVVDKRWIQPRNGDSGGSAATADDDALNSLAATIIEQALLSPRMGAAVNGSTVDKETLAATYSLKQDIRVDGLDTSVDVRQQAGINHSFVVRRTLGPCRF